MNFIKNIFIQINHLNKYVSFHLLAINGIISLLLLLPPLRVSLITEIYFGFMAIWILIITISIAVIEWALDFTISNEFIVDNIILKTIRYIGITALIFIVISFICIT